MNDIYKFLSRLLENITKSVTGIGTGMTKVTIIALAPCIFS